jgi:signal peptidase I
MKRPFKKRPGRRGRTGKLLALAGGVLALLAAWHFFAPTQLGGRTSYAVIVGSSMEPMLHRGDLAIVRAEPAYEPGDVVLYDSEEIGAKVLHRIRGVEGGRFVLRGDNNPFFDSEHPAESQLVGTLWFHVPNVGLVTEWVRVPGHAALIVGLATLLALGGGVGVGAATRRRRPAATGPSSDSASPEAAPLLAVLGGVAAAFALLAVLSFGRPPTQLVSVPESYAQRGTFDYQSAVRPSAAYPTGRVITGDPVFLRLVQRLRVGFDYALESTAAADGSGRIRLDAKLSDGRGWARALPLAPARTFSGTRARTDGTLDLRRLQTLIRDLRTLTGSPQTTYTLTVTPHVTIAGRVGDEEVQTAYSPALTFELDDLRLEPKLVSGGGVSPFAPREPVAGTQVVARRVSLGALGLPVATARRLSLLGLLAVVLIGLLTAGPLLRRRGGGEGQRIEGRYGRLLLPISARPEEWTHVTDVADIESLARLAEHYDRMILRVEESGGESYLVEESGTVYRYRSGEAVAVLTALPGLDEELTALVRPSRPSRPAPGAAGALIHGGNGRRYGAARPRLLRLRRGGGHENW